MAIPQCDPKAACLRRRTALDAALGRVLDSGEYILGKECAAFEQEFAAFLHSPHGVATGSGTDALELCLRACGIGPGHGVATVSHTAVATVAAIERTGAIPFLVDVARDSFCMDPRALEQVLDQDRRCGKTIRAILPVHLYGRMADMTAILDLARHFGPLPVIEDCAQAHGAATGQRLAGTWGTAAAFSFYPTKNLGAFGDGGLAATGDDTLAATLRQLRQYGWQERHVSQRPGINSRLDEMQAALLRVMLGDLEAGNRRRVAIARCYRQAITAPGVTLPEEVAGHVYHQYVLRTPRRDALRDHLAREAIGTAIHYPLPVHLMPAYRGRLPGHDRLPQSEALVGTILSLPMFPELTDRQVSRIIEVINQWL